MTSIHLIKEKNFFNEKFELLLGKKRVKNEKIMRNHYLIAGAMQRAFEKIVFHLLKILKSKGSKSNNLVLAGGAAMNCVFNGLLDKSSLYKNNYIPAYPDDLGVSIGAAYLANYRFNKKKKRIIFHEKHNYYGPGFSRNEIKDEILKSKLKFYEFTKDLTKETAKYLSKGKLVGWFQGNMEFSHRALGNRSILADPRSSKVKDLVNQAIKFRESFRPFAPAVLDREAYKIFHMKKNDKIYFMEKAVKVRKVWRKKIPAITHIDNTARVQTVNKSINPIFYDLISEFYKITKTPVLLNTSFNLNGEPIVCSPKDAIRTFFSCGLDILVLGNFIIKKND